MVVQINWISWKSNGYCGIILRGGQCSWIVNIILVREDLFSWVTGLLHHNTKQFMTLWSVCTLMKFKNLLNYQPNLPQCNVDSRDPRPPIPHEQWWFHSVHCVINSRCILLPNKEIIDLLHFYSYMYSTMVFESRGIQPHQNIYTYIYI